MLTCNACGQQWTRHPALEVECPTCHAAVARDCIRPSGHSGPFVEPHAQREQLAVDLGLLQLCSEGPTSKARQHRHAQPSLLDSGTQLLQETR